MATINPLLTSALVVAPYEINKGVRIHAGTSFTGLDECLIHEGRPTVYASHDLMRVSQGMRKSRINSFHLLRLREVWKVGKMVLESDQKQLVMKCCKEFTSSHFVLYRMLLRFPPCNLCIEYKQGKEMYIADASARATIPNRAVCGCWVNGTGYTN